MPIRKELVKLPPDAVVIHGGATGADQMASEEARNLGLSVLPPFLPDWEKYGKIAGFKRNIEMLDQKPDLVIAFWNGLSKGTGHTIANANERGIKVRIVSGYE